MSDEPKPDIGCCSVCGEGFPVCDLKTEQDGDWETGYYDIHICPKCPDGGCIDDYTMSTERAEEWWKWNSKNEEIPPKPETCHPGFHWEWYGPETGALPPRWVPVKDGDNSVTDKL